MQSQKSNWVQWVTLVGVIGVLAGGMFNIGFLTQDQPVIDEEALAKAVSEGIDIPVTDATKVDELYEDWFKEDIVEAEAEVLALEELEDDDYEELGEFIETLYVDYNVDEDETRVVIKDKTINVLDTNDKDVDVEFELKVYTEGKDFEGDYKDYITATIEIRDGEVEDMYFEVTD